jgi:hypothetical protein
LTSESLLKGGITDMDINVQTPSVTALGVALSYFGTRDDLSDDAIPIRLSAPPPAPLGVRIAEEDDFVAVDADVLWVRNTEAQSRDEVLQRVRHWLREVAAA